MTIEKKKRGPAPSGDSRKEIEKRSKQKALVKRKKEEFVDLKTTVPKKTRDDLTEIKSLMGANNIGMVISELVEKYKNSLKN